MPIPTPNDGEAKDDFLGRCMGNSTMTSEYPDQAQRYAVCYAQLEKSEKARKGAIDMPIPKDQERQAKNNLSGISPVEVSVCGAPMVPGAIIQLVKARNPEAARGQHFRKFAEFVEKDEEKQQLYAYVLIPDEPDWEGDVVSKAEVEAACDSFGFALSDGQQKGTGSGLNHEIFDGKIKVAQSCIDEEGALGKALGFANPVAGAWLIKLQVLDDEIWKGVKEGSYTGVSFAGSANRTPVGEPAAKSDEPGFIAKALITALSKMGYAAVPVKALDFDTAYISREVFDKLPGIIYAIEGTLYSIASDENLSAQQKIDSIKESTQQFTLKLLELFGQAEKSYSAMKAVVDQLRETVKQDNKTSKSNTGGDAAKEGVLEMEITQEQLQKMIADAISKSQQENELAKTLTGLKAEIAELKKSLAEQPKLEDTEFAKAIRGDVDVIADAVNHLVTRITGSKGLPNADVEPTPTDGDQRPVQKLKDLIVNSPFSMRKSQ